MHMRKILYSLFIVVLLAACSAPEAKPTPPKPDTAAQGELVELHGKIIAIDVKGFTLEMDKGELAICKMKDVSHISVGQTVTVHARSVAESDPLQVTVEKLTIEQ